MTNLATFRSSKGFTAVELLAAMVLFGAMVIGLITSYTAIRRAYATARQLSEVYTVLSACPEVDRALEYNSLSSGTNCYPNNTFQVENTELNGTISYSPTLTVSDTSTLASSDPLKAVPDSKVVDISVALPNSPSNPFKLRMLISRNGVGQQ